jgi:hypothetical protein
MAKQDWLPIWQLALQEPIGLLLRTNDPARAKAQLYRARADSQDPSLAALSIRTSPFEEGELVICRGTSATLLQSRESASGVEDLGL